MRKVRPKGPDRVMRNPARACATSIWELPRKGLRNQYLGTAFAARKGDLTDCHS
jgi:hypothetical protein